MGYVLKVGGRGYNMKQKVTSLDLPLRFETLYEAFSWNLGLIAQPKCLSFFFNALQLHPHIPSEFPKLLVLII